MYIFIAEEGEVISWGDNKYGQLGLGISDALVTTPHIIKTTLFEDNKVCNLQSGWTHMIAMTGMWKSLVGLLYGHGKSLFGEAGFQAIASVCSNQHYPHRSRHTSLKKNSLKALNFVMKTLEAKRFLPI